LPAIEVRSINPRHDPRWDAYVRDHPEGQAVHLAGYLEALERAYRGGARHLALVDGDRIRGVLPLISRRGPMSGRRLRSLPGMTAGPLVDAVDDGAALLRAAREVAEREKATLGVSSRVVGVDEDAAGVGAIAAPPTWILRLDSAPDDLRASWKRGSNLSRSLRKAEAVGMQVRLATSDADLRTFHELYARTMRKHLSMPRSLRQLRLERELLGDVARLFLVEHEGAVIAGGYYHAFNGRMVLVYNASHEDALALRPNHVLYWHTIGWAWDHGLPEFDFGYAWPDSALGKFKAQWGSAPVDEVFYAFPPQEQNVGGVPGGGSERVRQVLERMPLPLYRTAGVIAYRYL
jgi:CelD/BcsL family acetyltransferase involved in cellulose biosynthesis